MDLENVRVVMVEPLYGGNVGSVCRAMSNMGLSDLAIVTPRIGLDMNEAKMMACHSYDILANRTEFETMADAVADCAAVMGATARTGLYRQHAKTPREWAGTVLEMINSDNKVALVFGRENNGLSNEELALCTQIIQIPTADNSSLNVSQAAMVCCYEIFVASQVYEAPQEKSELATSEFRERMFDIWRETLLDIGFMEDDKATHMMLGLRRVLSRGSLSVDDVKIMMGIARQTEWAAGHSRKKKEEETLSSG